MPTTSTLKLSRDQYDNHLAWARAEYARIQERNLERYPRGATTHEPGEKSALFARLLSGKAPLPFPPPTSFNQPWYECIEERGPFHVVLGGMLPAWDVPTPDGTVFLEYLIVNGCPWGVVSGNESASRMSDLLARLRDCTDRAGGDAILHDIGECLLKRPEWIVRIDPWSDFRVYLGRAKRQGKRREIENTKFFRHTLDGTNISITRVLIDSAQQAAGKAERLAHLKDKPAHLRTAYESQALKNLTSIQSDSGMDWVEYEADAWSIASLDPSGGREKLGWFAG